MRKVLAALLAASLVLQPCSSFNVMAYGSGIVSKAVQKESSVAKKAVLEVEVLSSLLFPYGSKKVTINISKDGAIVDSKILSFDEASKDNGNENGASKPSKEFARFFVNPGTYKITVETDKFARYEQEVTAKSGCIEKIQVYSVKTETGSMAKPGWIRTGDVTNDGVIDVSDKESMLSVIRSNSYDISYDLNDDKKTDIADLQALVQGLGETQQVSSIEQLCLPLGADVGQGTVITAGSVEELINDGKQITLETKNADVISENNPVEMEFVLADDNVSENVPEIGGITIQAPAATEANEALSSDITNGEIVLTYLENGQERELAPISLAAGNAKLKASRKQAAVSPSVSVDANGCLVVNLGTQIAVKRVSIKITGTKKNSPLVNIAKVEFVNDMDQRIPAPQLNIPEIIGLTAGSKKLTVSWKPQNNVSGYEIFVSGPKGAETQDEQIISVTGSEYTISAINNKSLTNKETYSIKVRSVNGDWKSPWSELVEGTPHVTDVPAPPDNVKATAGNNFIKVVWKDMDDANGYMVYYKKSKDSEYQPVVSGFTPVKEGTGMLEGNSYTITGLEENTEYSVYVIGWNEFGWGKPSIVSIVMTGNMEAPKLPNYKLLNTSNGEGKVTAHIVNATIGGSNSAMVSSPLDTEKNSALGLVDNDFGSYWSKADFDDGVHYPSMSKGMFITLDSDYKMNYFTFAAAGQELGANLVRIEYWNQSTGSSDDARITVGARLIEKLDENNNPFYIVKLDETITANKIHMSLGRTWSDRTELKVGEIHFHKYDSLEDDIMGLYADEMHTTLREGVDKAAINALSDRLEVTDTESGEKHPLYSQLKLEIKTALEILESKLDPSYEVINKITPQKDTYLGFSGLNAWQPLGKTAPAGTELLVYVGHNTKRTGDATNLKLVMAQHHSEASSVVKTVNLKVGRNEVTVPTVADKDFERGGQIYIAYDGNSDTDKYAVRVSGADSIPVLNVYGKTGAERTKAISDYISELESYVTSIEENHNNVHLGTKNANYSYDEKNCILNATDIMMESMMYSLPATQVLAGIGSVSDKTAKLDNSLQAMEKAMTLFYQHKGLSNEAGDVHGNNALPSQHLNIRYMRMFAGAFMYASGNHIGIEWGSSTIASAMNDWNSMGWGIAHEIGHDINQGTYAVAEITNNYFAQLITIESRGTRFSYEDVYKKVTSGAKGYSPNVFTQLAMYWQLHLLFDDKEDRYIFDNYDEQFSNLFFARVDTYCRNPEKAPVSGLELDGGVDQNLMRLSCAAANKNILPFFERWGMEPDSVTEAYAKKYGEADTRALYYVNDDARDYRAANTSGNKNILNEDVVEAKTAVNSNSAEITISTSADADLILGYEIIRCMTNNGKEEEQVVGFKTIDTAESTVFTDTVSTLNNRVMTYKVRAVDKFLNYSNKADAGSVKIQTDGVLDKSLWTVETDMTSQEDIAVIPGEDEPDSGYSEDGTEISEKKLHTIDRVIDNDKTAEGTYNGNSTGLAAITIDMNKSCEVTALKYSGDALDKVSVEVSADGKIWTMVKQDYTGFDGTEGKILWFDSVNEDARDNWIGTYDARYVKISINKTGNISIKEIDLCGPTGDNVEFLSSDNTQHAIGILKADYKYGDTDKDVIPAGSVIFTGTYKGNPAYNVVMLYDTKGNVIGAKSGNVEAGQIILADVPKEGNLGETSDGIWIYYLNPGQFDEASLKSIEGVRCELYRVDDAVTLEGERIVSDTKVIEMPSVLPEITLTTNPVQ